MESARSRSGPVYVTPMIESTLVDSSAAAAPWKARATISISGVVESPQAADATVKRMRPAENIRRRPSWSPSRPAVISGVAKVRPYPATTHSIAPVLAGRSGCIAGGAASVVGQDDHERPGEHDGRRGPRARSGSGDCDGRHEGNGAADTPSRR